MSGDFMSLLDVFVKSCHSPVKENPGKFFIAEIFPKSAHGIDYAFAGRKKI
ncbi:MAG: hypothetical protein Ct9H300mP21_10260 [Pseudomonadota bacterium]|nr:MAG: hypothetical protein Ct9H300mP21_10260 [Pseudomonadota bacterium]